jgi:hypothetical protein
MDSLGKIFVGATDPVGRVIVRSPGRSVDRVHIAVSGLSGKVDSALVLDVAEVFAASVIGYVAKRKTPDMNRRNSEPVVNFAFLGYYSANG